METTREVSLQVVVVYFVDSMFVSDHTGCTIIFMIFF